MTNVVGIELLFIVQYFLGLALGTLIIAYISIKSIIKKQYDVLKGLLVFIFSSFFIFKVGLISYEMKEEFGLILLFFSISNLWIPFVVLYSSNKNTLENSKIVFVGTVFSNGLILSLIAGTTDGFIGLAIDFEPNIMPRLIILLACTLASSILLYIYLDNIYESIKKSLIGLTGILVLLLISVSSLLLFKINVLQNFIFWIFIIFTLLPVVVGKLVFKERINVKKFAVISVIIIVVLTAALAQFLYIKYQDKSPEVEWNRIFGGSGKNDAFYSVQQTSDGGYIAAGYTDSSGAGLEDVWLIKTDISGNTQWSKTFGGKGSNKAFSVKQTTDRGYIIAGYMVPGQSGLLALAIKTDANGNEQWNRTYKKRGYEGYNSVQQVSDGGYIFAGWTKWNWVSGEKVDAWLVKTDANGNEQWNRTFIEQEDTVEFKSILQTTDDGYIILGGINSGSHNKRATLVVRTNASGYELWSKIFSGKVTYRFGEKDQYTASSVQQTSDGDYIIAGSKIYPYINWGELSYNSDTWLIKIDNKGNEQWNKTFGGEGYEWANSVQQTSDGGYILAGITSSYGAMKGNALLIKTDEEGNMQWSKTLGDKKYTSEALKSRQRYWGAESAQQTSDGGYIVAGHVYSDGAYSAWLIKVKSTGNQS